MLNRKSGSNKNLFDQALWDSLPGVYRQYAKVYTDYREAYQTVIPSKRHEAVGKRATSKD